MSDDDHVRTLAQDPVSGAALVQAAVDQVERRLGLMRQRWATVVTYRPEGDQTTVKVDGDAGDTEVVNGTGQSLSEGQRALVQFIPPHGAVIIGTRPGRPIEWTPELTNIDVGDGSVYAEWFAVGPLVHFMLKATLGSGSSVTGAPTFSLPVAGSTIAADAEWGAFARVLIGSGRYVGVGSYDPVGATTVGGFAGDGDLWDATHPAAWGSGTVLRITGEYPRSPLGGPLVS